MYRFQGLDSLMTAKGITDSGTFDAYLKEVLSKRESQGANLTGFVFDTPQLDFSFKVLQAEAKMLTSIHPQYPPAIRWSLHR